MAQSTTGRAAVFLLRDIVGEILYWPVWWWTVGLGRTVRSVVRRWLQVAANLSLTIMFRSLFKPMYADYSRSGRAISFFIRLILIGWRIILLGIWTVALCIIVLLWIVAPLIAAGMLIRQLIPNP